MSTFSPEQLLQQETDKKGDTRFPTCPAGEHKAQVSKLAIREIKQKDNNETRHVLDVTWEVLESQVREQMGIDHVFARQTIFLDLTNDGSLDMGPYKNSALNRLREALGQNDATGWRINKLMQQMAKVRVEHSPNAQDPENPFANVTRVAPIV
jgi:hypothetical protein